MFPAYENLLHLVFLLIGMTFQMLVNHKFTDFFV